VTRTGVLGGTFDPPHLAHLVLAAAAREVLRLDRVLFVPAGEPWRKADRAVTPASERLEMVEAAVAPFAWAEVSRVEIDRSGPSYASETMAALAAEGGDWWFILGSDALADLPAWHEPQALIEVTRLAVAVRPPATLHVPDETARSLPGIEARIDIVPMPSLDISSTDVRDRVRARRSVDVIVPQAVCAVIEARRLYR
jgi:nicotinate-nucleotide adenylyltransferase